MRSLGTGICTSLQPCLRTKVQITTKHSPFYFMFGREARYPSEVPETFGDYNLNFGYHGEKMSKNWHGGVATVEESIGKEVWGVIWKMNQDDLASLDKQEGVDFGIYRPLQVKVDTDGGEVACRTYQMNNFTANLPSPPYMQVIRLGAKQNRLPVDYIRKLEAVKTNDYSGPSILDDIKKSGNWAEPPGRS